VLVTPLDFPALARDGRTVAETLAVLKPRLVREIQRRNAYERAALLAPATSELRRIDIDYRPDSESAAVPITLGVVVTARRQSLRTSYLVRVPAIPHFARVLSESVNLDVELPRLAQLALQQVPTGRLLTVVESEESRLDLVEIEVPEEKPAGEQEVGASQSFLASRGRELTAPDAVRERSDLRDEIVARILGTLSGPGRSSIMLVGPGDVGKTAIVSEIAARLAGDDVPAALRGRKLWRVSANEIIAGARYTGMWQDQFRRVIEELCASRAICVMEDPIAIIDAGRWSESDNNASRQLRPYIESGEITVICEATDEVLAAAQLREPSFVAAFHRIDVPEPGPEIVRGILAATASRLAAGGGVEITTDAIDAAIELTRRFEPYRSYPGKAVRLLKECVRDRASSADRIDRSEVTRVFARGTGLPLVLLSDDVPLDMAQVREHFESRVLGQRRGTSAMTELVAVIKAGLMRPGKPLRSFFFVGPTGVGKTELAKALAEFLFGSRDRVLRLDMAEYGSGDALAKLIGSGWRESEGELTRRVRAQPFSVVLLDEIEKAHPSVFDALLGVLGEGRLTDAGGRTANFESAIVVMTSNLGASRVRTATLGFSAAAADSGERRQRHYVDELRSFFRPEFINRIDQIVVFDPLDETVVRQIVRRELGRIFMREGIVRRKLLLEVDDDVVDALAKAGMDPEFGARPLQRAIESAVIQPLARAIIERHPAPGSLARIRLRSGTIAIDLEVVKDAEARTVPRDERRVPPVDRSLGRALTAAQELERRLAVEGATPTVVALRAEVSSLLARSHDPAFWDDNLTARQTLARIYQLESVLDRLDALTTRAAGLTEMATAMAASRSRERLGELWNALEEIEDALSVCHLELAGAVSGAGGKGAILSIQPVGDAGADWANDLFEMYCSWAKRTARDITPLPDRRFAARIEGLATFDLLRGENGLHRRIHADHRVLLARVTVTPPDTEALRDGVFPIASVVRIYEEGKRQLVRDPRTGAKETKVDAVLREGKIDPFLLAWLRAERDRRTH
jgi:ATP-dependent Clp protease ATP-binding subunit ClpA